MNDNTQHIPFIGKGWSFPPRFNRGTKEVLMSEGSTDIKESLEILLSTRPGERMMAPKYGCNLNVLLFEPLDISLENYVSDLIRDAIVLYEPRIDVEEVTFDNQSHKGLININIQYIIRSTNSRANMVYPFYLQEGTNLE